MNEGTARQYGPRDAASVLMYHRRKVALVDGKQWVLDGKPVSYRQLEDAAERYETGDPQAPTYICNVGP